MDTKQLTENIKAFQYACSRTDYAFKDFCFKPAYPGDDSSSYVLEIKAPWVDKMACSEVLDALFDILFDTTTAETRQQIFSIQLLDTHQQLHCTSEPVNAGIVQNK